MEIELKKSYRTHTKVSKPTGAIIRFKQVKDEIMAVEPHVPSYMHATHVIPQKYPCNLPAFDRTKTMGISRLCVGYLAQDDKTYMSLYNNFEHLLLSAPAECLSEMYELYGNILPVEIPWRDLRRNYYPNYWFYFTRKSVMESFL